MWTPSIYLQIMQTERHHIAWSLQVLKSSSHAPFVPIYGCSLVISFLASVSCPPAVSDKYTVKLIRADTHKHLTAVVTKWSAEPHNKDPLIGSFTLKAIQNWNRMKTFFFVKITGGFSVGNSRNVQSSGTSTFLHMGNSWQDDKPADIL